MQELQGARSRTDVYWFMALYCSFKMTWLIRRSEHCNVTCTSCVKIITHRSNWPLHESGQWDLTWLPGLRKKLGYTQYCRPANRVAQQELWCHRLWPSCWALSAQTLDCLWPRYLRTSKYSRFLVWGMESIVHKHFIAYVKSLWGSRNFEDVDGALRAGNVYTVDVHMASQVWGKGIGRGLALRCCNLMRVLDSKMSSRSVHFSSMDRLRRSRLLSFRSISIIISVVICTANNNVKGFDTHELKVGVSQMLVVGKSQMRLIIQFQGRARVYERDSLIGSEGTRKSYLTHQQKQTSPTQHKEDISAIQTIPE